MVKKIIVSQTGSRHRYLIPKLLENNDLLSRLYTDMTVDSICGKIALFLYKYVGCQIPVISRLSKRLPQISKEKLYSTDILFLKEKGFSILKKDSLSKRYIHYNGFVGKCIKWGVGDADCVYNMYIENFDFLRYAKSKGLKIVVDIYETPMTYKYLIDEIDNNPEYAVFSFQKKAYIYSHEVRMHYMEKLLELADYYTIPSQFVIKSMSVFENFNNGKAVFLPYPSSIVIEKYNYSPKRHRIIWVGNDPVRKGLLYCARAADILRKKYPDLDFRVIGNIDERIKKADAFSSLNFVGVLDKEQLMLEYRSAEAYVFPTLFEGFAGTVIEAASCGCPIITTECAGTNINEFPAIYIPTRDVDAIVQNVVSIFENPSLRNDLSRKTYDYSVTLKPETYEKRMIAFFQSI